VDNTRITESGKESKIFYGWWIVLAGTAVFIISSGIGFYGHGVFLDPLIAKYGWSKGAISFSVTLYFIITGGMGAVIGKQIDRYGPRPVLVIGAIIVGLSFMLIWAPELWPETARDWYAQYEDQFWQQGRWLAGFREYSKDIDIGNFVLADVDAGPVLLGYGAGACAFGVGAARAMGRFDHAYALGAEAIVGSWPLPDGTLLGPRVLSNLSDAPYLGEAAVLFSLTRRSIAGPQAIGQGKLPWSVPVAILLALCVGTTAILGAVCKTRRWHKHKARLRVPAPKAQVSLWWTLMAAALLAWVFVSTPVALITLLAAQFIPFRAGKQPHSADADAANPADTPRAFDTRG